MNKVDRIIIEEIERLIISEAVDFTKLSSYSQQLNTSVGNLRSIQTNGFNDDLKKFLNDLSIYGVQIIAAINRCIKATNLNEASWGGLSSYGINLPPELGGNIWSDAKEGYYKTKNFFQNRKGYNSIYGNANGNSNINNNNVPTVKLSVLLQQLPQWQQAYQTKNRQYNIANLTQEPYNILGNIIPNIQAEYNIQVRNAQGTNP